MSSIEGQQYSHSFRISATAIINSSQETADEPLTLNFCFESHVVLHRTKIKVTATKNVNPVKTLTKYGTVQRKLPGGWTGRFVREIT